MIDGEYRRCRGHAGDDGDTPWFCGDRCIIGDDEAEPEPVAADLSDTGHPNIVRLSAPLPSTDGKFRILTVSAPNKDGESARAFLRSIGEAVIASAPIGVYLREDWDIGYVTLEAE